MRLITRTLLPLLMVTLTVLALGVLPGVGAVSRSWADEDGHRGHGDDQFIKVEGILDLPPAGPGGAPLTLPTATPVTVGLTFGLPSIHLDVVINSDTAVGPRAFSPEPVTLHDGDRVKARLVISGGSLIARTLQVTDFFELRLRGTAEDLAAPLSLPLDPSASATTFTLVFIQGPPAQSLPITITANTRAKDHPVVLHNGDTVEVKAVVRNGEIRAVRIEREEEFEDAD